MGAAINNHIYDELAHTWWNEPDLSLNYLGYARKLT